MRLPGAHVQCPVPICAQADRSVCLLPHVASLAAAEVLATGAALHQPQPQPQPAGAAQQPRQPQAQQQEQQHGSASTGSHVEAAGRPPMPPKALAMQRNDDEVVGPGMWQDYGWQEYKAAGSPLAYLTQVGR